MLVVSSQSLNTISHSQTPSSVPTQLLELLLGDLFALLFISGGFLSKESKINSISLS